MTMRRDRADKANILIYVRAKLLEQKTRCGAAGSARALGARCRRFESCHLDQKVPYSMSKELFYYILLIF